MDQGGRMTVAEIPEVTLGKEDFFWVFCKIPNSYYGRVGKSIMKGDIKLIKR